MNENKPSPMLRSFVAYCMDNPEQRFFQALRNWVRENIDADCYSILIAPEGWEDRDDGYALNRLRDTFHYEDDRLG